MSNSRPASKGGASRTLTRELKIVNEQGIHARPAALFVKTASRFESDITVEKDDAAVSGKSIMGLMTLGGNCGSVLRVTAEGSDAEQALAELAKLVADKFYED